MPAYSTQLVLASRFVLFFRRNVTDTRSTTCVKASETRCELLLLLHDDDRDYIRVDNEPARESHRPTLLPNLFVFVTRT